jgi:hypothetical protein
LYRIFLIGVPLLLAGLLGSATLAKDQTAELRARFEQESNPVRKAKMMPKLGTAQFSEIESDVAESNMSGALDILDQYRTEAGTCMNGLDATGVDAEKHSAGFKSLQISLREALRRLDSLMGSLTGDQQAPFLDVRKDLDRMNRHLIQELFPREPGSDAAPKKPGH